MDADVPERIRLRHKGLTREVPLLQRLCLSAGIGLPLLASGGLMLPELDFKFRNEFQTAYISGSSGGTGETRPNICQTFSGRYDTGDFGGIGGYVWTRSLLTGQRDEFRRRAFDCFEYGAEYDYTWWFTRDVGAYFYVDHIWSPSPGWYERSSTYHGVLLTQRFINPFVAPYWKFLGAYWPHQNEVLKLGLDHTFRAFERKLSVTPYAELINGDRRRLKQKYGVEATELYCGFRPMATEFGCVFLYRFAQNFATRFRLRNWNLVEHAARIHERNRDVSWAKTWVPAATLSLDVMF